MLRFILEGSGGFPAGVFDTAGVENLERLNNL